MENLKKNADIKNPTKMTMLIEKNPDGTTIPIPTKLPIERNTGATKTQQKVFIGAEEFLQKIWQLNDKIKNSNFKPDLILFPLRGGADIALCLSHQFDNTPMHEINASFRDWNEFKIPSEVDEILKNQQIKIKDEIKKINNVLIVDDICDSGLVMQELQNVFKKKYPKLNYPTLEFKFAVVYAKIKSKNIADYFGEEVGNEEWLVFHYTKEYREKYKQQNNSLYCGIF